MLLLPLHKAFFRPHVLPSVYFFVCVLLVAKKKYLYTAGGGRGRGNPVHHIFNIFPKRLAATLFFFNHIPFRIFTGRKKSHSFFPSAPHQVTPRRMERVCVQRGAPPPPTPANHERALRVGGGGGARGVFRVIWIFLLTSLIGPNKKHVNGQPKV